MHGFRRYVVLLMIMAALAVAVTACGGSGGSDDSSGSGDTGSTATSGGTTTYTNDQYGFSITYDTMFTQGEPVAGTGAGGSSVLDVVFADKDGPVVSDRYVDAIQVSVYELARDVKPKEVPKLKSEVQGIIDQMMSSISSAKVVEPLQEAEVNGLPGFAFKYTYAEGDTELTAVSFFLFEGKNEYQITCQSTSENWDGLKSKFDAAVGSFTVQ